MNAVDLAALLAWAQDARIQVSDALFADDGPLREVVGDAVIVSLGEGLHGAAEPLDFRNRLFRWLVERMGFRGIALESGLTAAFAADDFVRGGPGAATAVAASAITSGLGRYPQQAALLEWMRAINTEASGPRPVQPIRFFGMDTSAFPAEPGAAVDVALDALGRVAPGEAARLRDRLAPLRSRLTVDRFAPVPAHYALLDEAARDAASAVIADLERQLAVRAPDLRAAASELDAERAGFAALGARQADAYLRQFPPGWSAADGLRTLLPTVAASDRGKAEAVDRLLQALGPDGRLMVFSHLGHAASTAVSIAVGGERIALPPLMGTHLRRRHGTRMIVVGHLFAHDRCEAGRDPAPPGTLEAALAPLVPPRRPGSREPTGFLLDLRRAPPAARAALRGSHDLYGQRPVHALDLAEGVDVLLFTPEATAALDDGVS